MGRRPAVIGTGLDVWEIIEVVKDNACSIDETASYLEVDPRFVEAAARYYGSNREEIDDWIARARELAEREEAKCARPRAASRLEAAARRGRLAGDRPPAARPRP
jgi:uncharacterized protein (DUF433 family)